MADENLEQETEVTEADDKATGTDQTKTEKTFTQTEVNSLIAKEKASWKRSADREKTAMSETENSLREQVKSRDAIIQKNVDILKKDLNVDEEDWNLLMSDRDVLFQYDYLLQRVSKTEKKDIPRTPNGDGELKQKPTFKHNISTI